MLKLEVGELKISQRLRLWREGSVRAGTARSGVSALEVDLEIESDEPPEKIAELVRAAKGTCFTHGAIAEPVPIETSVKLNGETLTWAEGE
jgi:hypothetical protein